MALWLVVVFSFFFISLSVASPATCLAYDPANPSTYSYYVTFHADVKNIHHYSELGQFIGRVFPDSEGVSELRGMLLFENGNLITANAYKYDSKLFIGSECGLATKNTLTNSNLSHPYGLANGDNPVILSAYPNGTTVVYATNQDSLVVSYYVLDDTLSNVVGSGIFGQNSFLKPRGAAVDPITQQLIVADEDANNVYFLDFYGNLARDIMVPSPIGTYVSENILYVSSNDDSVPAVYAYNLSNSLVMTNIYQTPNISDMGHPCGISSCNDDLLVLSQDTRSLIVFSKSTAKYRATVINDFGDDPEQIIALNCYGY